jgi:phage pi2 protein 07
MKKKLFILLFICIIGSSRLISLPDDILGKIDENRKINSDISMVTTLITQKPDEEKSVFKGLIHQRMQENKTVFIILEPEEFKRTGYLQIENNVWVYDPESRRFSHSSLRDNIQNTNARNNDLKPLTLSRDYSIESSSEGKLGKYDVFVLDLKATSDQVTVPRTKIWVNKDNYLILKMEEYSLSERLVRTLYYAHYTKIKEHYLSDKILIIDNLTEGEKTQISSTNISLEELPDYYFTKAYLENVSR